MTPKTIAAILLACLPCLVFAQLPSGAAALYPLNNSANDISGNGYNGTLTGTSATTNRLATASAATAFSSGSSSGTLPGSLVTALQNDFSIGYWFKTSMTAPSSTQWYGGTALVDAEVCGGTSDWGTALINGGGIAFGMGNPDITIFSSATNYNDGNWHFVTATRAAASGTITLYVDGAQVATTTGTATSARTAPTLIGLGRNVCVTGGVYTGSLDDAIAYPRTLSSTEVSNLYNYSATVLPLSWISFTGQAKDDGVVLQWQVGQVSDNDRFEIERSGDGNQFERIGVVSNSDNSAKQGIQSYQFTDVHPARDLNFYRVRQVDIDGRASYSSVVEVKMIVAGAAIRLQTNPVRGTVTLMNPGQQLINRLQVLDASGRVLLSKTPNSNNSLITTDVQHIQPGYYLLRFGSAKTMSTIGFIKL